MEFNVTVDLPITTVQGEASANKTKFSIGSVNFIGKSDDIYVKGFGIKDTIHLKNGNIHSDAIGPIHVLEIET